MVKYSHEINGFTAINLTKLDILDTFEEIPVAIAYTHQGQTLDSFPASLQILENVEVKYETLPGWKSKTSGIRKFEELPANAVSYIKFIEQYVGVKVKYIGTGPARDDIISR
jgi:adenylosuccinate synthase